jgi:shikimate dehydrogenase
MSNKINNKTKYIYSFSSQPSNFGCTIYNHIFNLNNLNYVYLPMKITNAKSAINIIKVSNAHGASISMPLKNQIFKYLNNYENNVNKTKSVNTILFKSNKIFGYNSDIDGFGKSIEHLSPSSVAIYGTGSVVDSILLHLRKKKIFDIYIFGRNKSKIKKLKKKYNLNNKIPKNFDLFVNATPAVFNEDIKSLILQSNNIFDLKVSLKNTKIIDFSLKCNKKCITGLEMYKYQFIRQFKIYTGLDIKINDLNKILVKIF